MASSRNNLTLSVISKIPPRNKKAMYMTITGTVRNTASGLAAMSGAMILTSNIDGSIDGMSFIVKLSIVCIIAVHMMVVKKILPHVYPSEMNVKV